MTAITRTLYERYVLRVDTTRLHDLRNLLAPGEQTKVLPPTTSAGYAETSPTAVNLQAPSRLVGPVTPLTTGEPC